MPKIPVYEQQVQLAAGPLGPRAGAGLEAPGQALASFGKQVGDVAFKFGMMEKEKQVKDKDAENSENIARDLTAIENDPIYTTASDAKTAVDLYKTKTLADIDALDMTKNQKRELRLSATKSIAMFSLQAEQKAFNRGLQESGKNANALIASKLDMINNLSPGDARVEMLQADIDKYRKDAEDNGYAGYLEKSYQSKIGTSDEMAMRLASGVLADENITEGQVDKHISELGRSFENAEISEAKYRTAKKILESKKKAIKALNKAADPSGLKEFIIKRDDILFSDRATYTDVDTLREDIESGRGDFADVPKEKRRTLLVPVVAELNRRKAEEVGVLSQTIEFNADVTAKTGVTPPGQSEALARMHELDAVKAIQLDRAVEAGAIAAEYVANMQLASSEDWANSISDLQSEYNMAVAREDVDGALALKDALKLARKANADRIAEIKENPRKYWNTNAKQAAGVPTDIRGADASSAEYVEWVRSTGLIEEGKITVFTPEQSESIKERLVGLSPVGKRALYDETKQSMPGVSQRILMQSFVASGVDVPTQLMMVLSSNPIAADLNAAILMDDKDLKAKIGDTEVEKNIAAAVNLAMVDFNRSVSGTIVEVGGFANRASMGAEGEFGNRASFLGDMNKAVLKLAMHKVAFEGVDATQAAEFAARVHTDQFNYAELNGQPLRVPKKFGDAERTMAGLSRILSNVGQRERKADGTPGKYLYVREQNGATEQQRLVNTELYIRELQSKGAWMTSGDSQSAYMIDMYGLPVLDPNGDRITVQFTEASGVEAVFVEGEEFAP